MTTQKQCSDGVVNPDYPGSGAAGGMGFAFHTFLNATLKPGIEIILEETNLEKYIEDANLVVTGEGMLDFQTAMGKAPVGVAKLAKRFGKPVIAFAGGVTKDAVACNKEGIDAFFPIVRGATTRRGDEPRECRAKSRYGGAGDAPDANIIFKNVDECYFSAFQNVDKKYILYSEMLK